MKTQEKFLGVNPFRRIGKDTATPKLKISINSEGKRTVTWARQTKRVEMVEAGLKQNVGPVVKKPSMLVRVEPEDTFSGPSHFEWGEPSNKPSNKVYKPKQVWVIKRSGVERFSGGPIKEHVTAPSRASYCATNDVVTDHDISRASPFELTSTAHVYIQELTCLLFRTTREGEFRRIRVEYYEGINISVPRNIAGHWGVWLGDDPTKLLLRDSITEWADDVDEAVSEPCMESHSLAVVLCYFSREGSAEEIVFDITPLNSYLGESFQGDQSEWVRQNMEVFSKQMGVSIEGCELEAMALFMAIERWWRQPGDSRTRASTNQPKARKGVRELRNLSMSVNYGASLTQGSGRRSRGSVYSQCI